VISICRSSAAAEWLMAWSYSGDPSTSPKDEVRCLIGDTTEDDPLLQDEEIAYLLDQRGGFALAAAVSACEGIVAKLSREADLSSGATSISASQRRAHYASLLTQLQRRATRTPNIKISQTIPPRFQRGDDKYDRP